MKNKGNLIVISGPSGTGKGTVCKELLKAQPEIVFSISATTRKPRPGEVNGRRISADDSRKSFVRMG